MYPGSILLLIFCTSVSYCSAQNLASYNVLNPNKSVYPNSSVSSQLLNTLYSETGLPIDTVVLLGHSLCALFVHLCDKKRVQNRKNGKQKYGSVWFEPSIYSEVTAKIFVFILNEENKQRSHEMQILAWNSATNLTDNNKKIELEKSLQLAKFSKEVLKIINRFPWRSFEDQDLRRQFQKYSQGGAGDVLSTEDYEKLNENISKMVNIYSKSTVCEYQNPRNCSLALQPDLVDIFERSKDPKELEYYWLEWRKVSGRKCRKYFHNLVQLLNKSARMNNFKNAKEHMLFSYEDTDFESEVRKLWVDVRPLYEELHAYVRRMLSYTYGEDVVKNRGAIPAHLLGDMWAQEWINIYDKTQPFNNSLSVDVINDVLKKDYEIKDMFHIAEKFYQSINFTKLPDSFYKRSLFEKPKDREVVCHANAWDFQIGDDYRIKMCTRLRLNDLYTVHHEMGHVYYYIHYKEQPFVYRSGANPGFHEAVGDAINLSLNPTHLHNIGLFPFNIPKLDYMFQINYLYSKALSKLAILPWAYIMDLWRWKIYAGVIKPENYNCEWWKLRYEYQGVEPPVVRNEDDFDPASKFHIANNVPYIRYFVATALQFQFHRAMCEKAGLFDSKDPEKNPLHACSIYKNPEAGNAFGEMLRKGSSKPWRDVLESFTGERTVNADALLQYFAPLYNWLKQENVRHRNKVGWLDEPMRTGCVSARLSNK